MPQKKIKTEICLCGSGWGALAAIEGLVSGFSDVVVVTDDSDVKKRALHLGFEYCQSLQLVDAEFYLCAGFKPIFERTFVEDNRVINIHYSLLPKYRGLHSTIWAILNDEQFFGLTIYEMDEFIDAGPILYQYNFNNTGQTSLEVMQECNRHIEQNLSKVLSDIRDGVLVPINQDQKDATWTCKRNLDDCLIDFDQKNYFLELFFRALVEPYPLPRIQTKTRLLEVVKSELLFSRYYMHNGRVVNIEGEKAWIKVEEGFLVISEVRDSNTKEKLKISDVFNLGQRLK